MCFFSIIIPAYNVEDYLEKCVKSILEQNFDDCEIILVNDGSPDRCPEICDHLANSYHNVIAIHKKNGGLSSARNAGINAAKGKYLMFVDSDDYWEKSDCLRHIKNKITKNLDTDFLMYGHKSHNIYTDKIKTIRKYTSEDSKFIDQQPKEKVIQYLFNTKKFPTSAWTTIVRRELIIKNKIFFTEGLIAEDVDWKIALLEYTENFLCIDDVFYVYTFGRKNSLSNSSGKKGVESILYILERWIPVFQSRSDLISKKMIEFLSFHYTTVFLTYAYLPYEQKKEYHYRLKKYFYLLDNLSDSRTKLTKVILKTLGFEKGSLILRMIYKIYIIGK